MHGHGSTTPLFVVPDSDPVPTVGLRTGAAPPTNPLGGPNPANPREQVTRIRRYE